jgi:hypothetical protein
MSTPQAELRRMTRIRQVIYLLVAAAVIVPYLIELPLPFKPSDWARKLYDKVDALPPHSVVLFSLDYDPSAKAELNPMSLALFRHCFRKDLVPLVMTHWPNGVGLAKKLLEVTAAESPKMWGKEKVAGRDFVLLGFKPGGSNLLVNMGESLKTAFAKDYYDRPTQGMPALEGVNSLKDIRLAVDVAAGDTVEMWIAYGSDRFGFDLGAGTTAVMAPDLYPFLQSKQLVGFLGGLRGAADYEQLLEASIAAERKQADQPAEDAAEATGAPKRENDATRGMQVQSVTHVLIIVLILAANARYLVSRLRRRKKD